MKSIVFFIFLFPVFFSVNAQEKTNYPWNLKIGYSRINNYSFGNIGELSIEGNYKANKWIETGLYAGYTTSLAEHLYYSDDGHITGFGYETSPVLSYGINSCFYLSSLFFEDNFRLGLRIIMKPGGFYMFSQEGFEPRGHHFTFRTGLGIDYRIFRKMGLFGEYVYGFGDGTYRAMKGDRGMRTEVAYQKHIGSFRFGIHLHF